MNGSIISKERVASSIIASLASDHVQGVEDLMAAKYRFQNTRKLSLKPAFEEKIGELKEALTNTANEYKLAKKCIEKREFDAVIEIGLRTGIIEKDDLG